MLKQLQKVPTYEVRVVESATKAARLLEADDDVDSVEVSGETILVVLKSGTCEGVIAKLLVENGYRLVYLSRQSMRLEDVFLSITEGRVQ